MKKYLFTFFGGNPALKYSNLDQVARETRVTHLKEWSEWMAGLARTGHLESGYPLEGAGRNVSAAGIEDRDFSKGGAGGFIILKADSLDEAARIASTSPIIKNGGKVEVQPCGEVESQHDA